MAKIYQGDVGILVTVATGITLTGASSTVLNVKKPSGTTVQWAAAIDPINAQQLNYTTLTADLNEAGDYFIQPNVTLGSQILFGETVRVTIYGPYQ